MTLHADSAIGHNHILHNWVFANAAARTGATYVSADVGKEAFQTDTSTFWRIISVNTGIATFRESSGSSNSVSAKTFNTQAGTNYTLSLSDSSLDNKFLLLDNAAANTLTIPLNSAVPFPVGSWVDVQSIGVGQTTIVATGGVTITSSPGLKLADRYSCATLIKVATNSWTVTGRLAV